MKHVFWSAVGAILLPSLALGQLSHEPGCAHLKNAQAYSRLSAQEDNTGYDVKWYFLDLEATNTSASLSGSVTILLEATESLSEIMLSLHEDYTVDGVTVNDIEAAFIHDAGELEVLLAPRRNAGEMVECTITYHGLANLGDSFFRGITNDVVDDWNKRVTYTLSEPENAMDWFPVKQVLTDKADSMRFHITTPDHLKAGANGLLEQVVDLGDGRVRHEWASNYPIAYYLIAFVVAEFEEYNFTIALDGQEPLFVQNYLYDYPTKIQEYKASLDALDDMMAVFYDWFGPYPFAGEKYGHMMAPMGGAMEHQTMSTMGNMGFSIMAHELGHQWYGDYVTCGTWQDIWINEGFARYSEYLAIEHVYGREVAEEWRASDLERILSDDGGSVYVPATAASNENRIFEFRLTYSKGGQLLHMLRNELNDDELLKTVFREQASAHALSTATGEDFLDVLNEQTGEDYTWFMEQWYYGSGHPIYDVIWEYQADTLWMQINQEPSLNSAGFFRATIPFQITYADGSTEMVRVSHTADRQQIPIPVSKQPTDLEMDPENWILKEVNAVIYGGVVGLPTEARIGAKLYPQPSRGLTYLEGPVGEAKIEVVDIRGRQHQAHYRNFGGRWEIDATSLPTGMYQVRVFDEEGGFTLPLLVQ